METGFEYLGMPYWDWTQSIDVPDLFDNVEFPTAFDQMISIQIVKFFKRAVWNSNSKRQESINLEPGKI